MPWTSANTPKEPVKGEINTVDTSNASNESNSTPNKVTKIEDNKPAPRISFSVINTDEPLTKLAEGESYKDYSEKITRVNPMVERVGNKNNDTNVNRLEAHFNKNINAFKECFIWTGGINSSYTENEKDGNTWRFKNINNFTQVNKKVKLYSDTASLDFNYSHIIDFEDPISSFIGGNSIISGIREFAVYTKSMGTNATLTTRFPKAPIYKETSTLGFRSSLKFDFHFGDFGMFSGLDEVVTPIIALASLFALKPDKNDNKKENSLEENYRGFFTGNTIADLIPPMPTKSRFMNLFGQGAINAMGNSANNLASSLGSTTTAPATTNSNNSGTSVNDISSAIANLTLLQKLLMSTANMGVQAIVNNNDNEFKLIHIQIGHFYMGPCVVKEVNYNFDYSLLDEMGWPSTGSITLGGIQTLEIASSPLVIKSAFNV